MIDLLRQRYTRIVAGCTIATDDIRIMHKGACEAIKSASDMAGRTVQVRPYVTNRFACTDITVMAGEAVTAVRAGVIKRRSGKVGGVMAIGAILVVRIGRYVVRQFTHANHIVVA